MMATPQATRKAGTGRRALAPLASGSQASGFRDGFARRSMPLANANPDA
jgi:hypothetical protein